MSVIAKLQIRSTTDYGTGRLVELSCVCDNDLMAAYAGSEEDKLFTKYSPWGELKLSQPEGWTLGNGKAADEFGPAPAFYVMALHESEHEYIPAPSESYRPDANFPGASAWVFGRCHVVSDFGGTCHVEFRGGNGGDIKGRAIEKLNWKMSVDNPGASNQFKPGQKYWIALYDASKFDRDGAIRAAHGHPVLTEAEA
jgi:hypothetical protein